MKVLTIVLALMVGTSVACAQKHDDSPQPTAVPQPLPPNPGPSVKPTPDDGKPKPVLPGDQALSAGIKSSLSDVGCEREMVANDVQTNYPDQFGKFGSYSISLTLWNLHGYRLEVQQNKTDGFGYSRYHMQMARWATAGSSALLLGGDGKIEAGIKQDPSSAKGVQIVFLSDDYRSLNLPRAISLSQATECRKTEKK
jgi:hypothetical protein